MEMFMQFINIQRYVAENGRLPSDLAEVGEGPDEVLYTLEAGNTFRLTGTVGEITVDFSSTEPVEALLGDAIAIVSGGAGGVTFQRSTGLMIERTIRERKGVTLIELLVVVLIVSILAAIAQPRLSGVIVKARAADAISDMQVIRLAVYNYQTDQQAWPSDVERGIVPPGSMSTSPAASTSSRTTILWTSTIGADRPS